MDSAKKPATLPGVAMRMSSSTSAAYFRPASGSLRPYGPRYGSGEIAWCTPWLCGTLYFHVLCDVRPIAELMPPW